METVEAQIPGSSYPIHISGDEAGSFRPLRELLEDRPALILTSPRVARHTWRDFKKACVSEGMRPQSFLIADGERHKTLKNVERAYHSLVRLRADRSTCLVILGGGVLGDLGGFVAATYLRGIPFVQVPTTLVAQVDSSIGGKVGVDLAEGKNLVGAFAQPKAVFSHVPFLKTLPKREILGGLAEVVKYGVIEDPQLISCVRDHKRDLLAGETEVLLPIVKRSSEIKARVVSQDEKEAGLRMLLNFGHTFGHALERMTKYRRYHHGEAVAIGMVMAARISKRLGYCNPAEADILEEIIAGLGLPTKAAKFSESGWLRALEVDKKSRGGIIWFVVMKKLGEVDVVPISPKELARCL